MNMLDVYSDNKDTGLNKIAEEEPNVEKDEDSSSDVENDDSSSFNTSIKKRGQDSKKGRDVSISENSISLTSSKP